MTPDTERREATQRRTAALAAAILAAWRTNYTRRFRPRRRRPPGGRVRQGNRCWPGGGVWWDRRAEHQDEWMTRPGGGAFVLLRRIGRDRYAVFDLPWEWPRRAPEPRGVFPSLRWALDSVCPRVPHHIATAPAQRGPPVKRKRPGGRSRRRPRMPRMTCPHRYEHRGMPCPDCAADRAVAASKGADPARGFVYETVPYVSAATLAYDLEAPPIELRHRTKKKPGVVRLASPFTVESESPVRFIPGDAPPDQRRESETVLAIVSALETSGVKTETGETLRVETMEPHWAKGGSLITHLADSDRGRIAVAVFPDDITVSPAFAALAAEEAREIGVETLLLVAFAFETGPPPKGAGPPVRVLRAQANRDLMIGNLADARKDAAIVLVGEPEVAVEPVDTPDGRGLQGPGGGLPGVRPREREPAGRGCLRDRLLDDRRQPRPGVLRR